MSQCDLVIGAITGYKWSKIQPWVHSLDRSGFSGLKAVIAYNVDRATLEELRARNYSIFAFQEDVANKGVTYPNKAFAVVVDRFLHYYLMLDKPESRERIRYVLATDVRDVIFQRNPSEYLDAAHSRGVQLLVSSEGIAYQHETWNANNLLESFGRDMYDKHKENVVINCGVLAGRLDAFLGLSKSVYLLSHGAVQHVPGGGGPDQAALNLLLSTAAYEHMTEVATHACPWAAQLGVTMDPQKLPACAPFLQGPLPRFNRVTGLVETALGEPYAIVHQWDRVPDVRAAVERLYT